MFAFQMVFHVPQEMEQSTAFLASRNKFDVGMVKNATVGSAKYIFPESWVSNRIDINLNYILQFLLSDFKSYVL